MRTNKQKEQTMRNLFNDLKAISAKSTCRCKTKLETTKTDLGGDAMRYAMKLKLDGGNIQRIIVVNVQ